MFFFYSLSLPILLHFTSLLRPLLPLLLLLLLLTFSSLLITGFQVLVGFKDRVRLYNILSDKFKLYRETLQKSCKELKYSNGCQYWAGASAMVLVVYDSASFTQLMAFQGHMMIIRRLMWAPGDLVRNVPKRIFFENVSSDFFCHFFYLLFFCYVLLCYFMLLCFLYSILRYLFIYFFGFTWLAILLPTSLSVFILFRYIHYYFYYPISCSNLFFSNF